MSVPIESVSQSQFSKKLLVLDINGLLLDTVFKYEGERPDREPDGELGARLVYERPFCRDFVEFCLEKFVVGVWSSARMHNVEALVRHIFGDNKGALAFVWDQSKCTLTTMKHPEKANKPVFLKELSKLWDSLNNAAGWGHGRFRPCNTLLVDDSPYKAICNPAHTAVFPLPYKAAHADDVALGTGGLIRTYLEGLSEAADVQAYVQRSPFGEPALAAGHPLWDQLNGLLKGALGMLGQQQQAQHPLPAGSQQLPGGPHVLQATTTLRSSGATADGDAPSAAVAAAAVVDVGVAPAGAGADSGAGAVGGKRRKKKKSKKNKSKKNKVVVATISGDDPDGAGAAAPAADGAAAEGTTGRCTPAGARGEAEAGARARARGGARGGDGAGGTGAGAGAGAGAGKSGVGVAAAAALDYDSGDLSGLGSDTDTTGEGDEGEERAEEEEEEDSSHKHKQEEEGDGGVEEKDADGSHRHTQEKEEEGGGGVEEKDDDGSHRHKQEKEEEEEEQGSKRTQERKGRHPCNVPPKMHNTRSSTHRELGTQRSQGPQLSSGDARWHEQKSVTRAPDGRQGAVRQDREVDGARWHQQTGTHSRRPFEGAPHSSMHPTTAPGAASRLDVAGRDRRDWPSRADTSHDWRSGQGTAHHSLPAPAHHSWHAPAHQGWHAPGATAMARREGVPWQAPPPVLPPPAVIPVAMRSVLPAPFPSPGAPDVPGAFPLVPFPSRGASMAGTSLSAHHSGGHNSYHECGQRNFSHEQDVAQLAHWNSQNQVPMAPSAYGSTNVLWGAPSLHPNPYPQQEALLGQPGRSGFEGMYAQERKRGPVIHGNMSYVPPNYYHQ
eukprot:jgi/Mesen1/502/ME000104S10596